MIEALQQLGLSKAEADAYVYVLDVGVAPARDVATHIGQTRTNTYAILARLTEQGLLIEDESVKVRRYSAADPSTVKQLILDRQRQLYVLSRSVDAITPALVSRYRLGLKKPGVLYLEGLDGLKASLEDMARANTEILLWGSSTVPENPPAYEMLQKAAIKRKARGIPTRMLLEQNARTWPHIHDFAKRGFTVRASPNEPIEAEIAIYGDTVCMTSYAPHLIVTVLTNETIARTYRIIFEEAWRHAQIVEG